MNKKLDFNPYDDILLATKYDGFIDQNGNYYKVNPRNDKLKAALDHNLWAEEYIKNHGDKLRKLNFKASGLFTLSQISSPSEVLVNIYGFVYYSHEPILGRPIIMIPNPKYNNYFMNNEQEEALFSIMLLNGENPNYNPIFTNDDVFSYFGSEEVDYGKGKNK